MTPDEKLKKFEQVLERQHEAAIKIIKDFLMIINPDPATCEAMKESVQNHSVLIEADLIEYLNKFIEYKTIMKNMTEKMHSDSVKAQFNAIMERNFK